MKPLPNKIEDLIKELEKITDFQIQPSWSIEAVMWHAGRQRLVEELRYRLEAQNEIERGLGVILKGQDDYV